MSEIPEGAVQAVAELLHRDYDSEYGADHLSWRDFAEQARKLLEAAAPILADQVRREVADQFRALASRLRAVPDKGLTLGQTWDRDSRAMEYDRLADVIERGAFRDPR